VEPDERQRLSAVAHATSAMWGPISSATLAVIEARVGDLGLDGRSRVLDLGCGPAELLRRIAARTGASGVGVDSSPYALAEARRRLAGTAEADRIDLRLADVTALEVAAEFDLVLCIGPGWHHGGWEALTGSTLGHVAPRGWMLLGDGAWRAAPSPGDLRATGLSRDDYPATAEVLAAVRRGGADPDWCHVVDPAEWEAYGAAYRAGMLAFLARSPNDPLAPALRERSGPGWPAYERLHELLDFVIVLAARP
jgi:SAM-dependent methyltransferase